MKVFFLLFLPLSFVKIVSYCGCAASSVGLFDSRGNGEGDDHEGHIFGSPD